MPTPNIDPKVLEADARANILDWPVNARHKGRDVVVGLQAIEDLDVLVQGGGGLLDDKNFGVIAIASDFGRDLPKTFDDFSIQLSDGTWMILKVRNTPDRYDPLSPTITVYLQSRDK
jgi:hypothetical protein